MIVLVQDSYRTATPFSYWFLKFSLVCIYCTTRKDIDVHNNSTPTHFLFLVCPSVCVHYSGRDR